MNTQTRTSSVVKTTCSTLVSLEDGYGGFGYGGVMSRTLVIKLTAGAEEPERANQAFTVAATAVAAGATVSLWLTGEAVWFAVPGRAEAFELPHAAPLADLLPRSSKAVNSPSAPSAPSAATSPNPTSAPAPA